MAQKSGKMRRISCQLNWGRWGGGFRVTRNQPPPGQRAALLPLQSEDGPQVSERKTLAFPAPGGVATGCGRGRLPYSRLSTGPMRGTTPPNPKCLFARFCPASSWAGVDGSWEGESLPKIEVQAELFSLVRVYLTIGSLILVRLCRQLASDFMTRFLA